MSSLIINLPHLQSRRQRHAAMLLSLLCWGWFLMPLVIVGGWLLGFRALAQEVVWFGGWQSLVHLASTAVGIIAALSFGWAIWTVFDMRQPPARVAPAKVTADSARAFGVPAALVAAAIDARLTTVDFGPDCRITGITPDQSAGRVRHQPSPLRRAG